MAQLNPNFEIDFSDINSYEQIQLINDTQLAKENLLMHKAYKEPSDDAIIRNHFSSFTFVDFCPRLFSVSSQPNRSLYSTSSTASNAQNNETCNKNVSTKCYEIETFSDLFHRINTWLKLNKDWRVVSMETLKFDCTSQFNHLKSSIYSNYLPQNTRGLRLFLSPSKSRFSGYQKIGCINVVPKKVSGSYTDLNDPPVYETLDDILDRLNELLLTRPIEGRILSVETITLPMVNGYVDIESNYFMDGLLNYLGQKTYCSSTAVPTDQRPEQNRLASDKYSLIDILRVYYEFGPMVCGLVNLIDFVPRFYSPTPTTLPSREDCPPEASDEQTRAAPLAPSKLAATESLTRLIRRSLAWFESERKRLLQTQPELEQSVVNLKLCNLQVRKKVIPKSRLVQVGASQCALEVADTRTMAHQRINLRKEPLSCTHCPQARSTLEPAQNWCNHLLDLVQPYELKFVRLAYVVPVIGNFLLPPHPLSVPQSTRFRPRTSKDGEDNEDNEPSEDNDDDEDSISTTSSSSSSAARETSNTSSESSSLSATNEPPAGSRPSEPGGDKRAALAIVRETSQRHAQAEAAHQAGTGGSDALGDSPIGQLTYRLFAPCQLVSSSSCFSINPVNSSSPLARRGSLNLNGTGLSSESAHPSSSLLLDKSPAQLQVIQQPQGSISFGALFPAIVLNQDQEGQSNFAGAANGAPPPLRPPTRLAANEFEPVEAIRRRMEVYVTTNSMKVVAGETIIVQLNDVLSCLSTAIEQTLAPWALGRSLPTTWVSVYILYAAVEEPLLPAQLLASQRLKEQLELIDEEEPHKANVEPADLDAIFANDFQSPIKEEPRESPKEAEPSVEQDQSQDQTEVEPRKSQQLYNSAYDRTVALPTQPENHVSHLEPIELLDSITKNLWIDEDQLIDFGRSPIEPTKRKSRRRKSRRRHEDSQCSVI